MRVFGERGAEDTSLSAEADTVFREYRRAVAAQTAIEDGGEWKDGVLELGVIVMVPNR